jgi:uncharacterized protein YndB with AHSA1/START domain
MSPTPIAVRVTRRFAAFDAAHTGRYLVIDRPHRLVFSFSADGFATEPDRVAIELLELPTGCQVTLVHEMKPGWAAYADRTQAGWGVILDGLTAVLDAASRR